MKLRPQVQAFAEAMEVKLRKNDHKGGWDECTTGYLTRRLRTEVRELIAQIGKTNRAYDRFVQTPFETKADLRREGSGGFVESAKHKKAKKKHAAERAKLLGEAADVANFAMMIADVIGALETKR